jgi:hypothetical protein
MGPWGVKRHKDLNAKYPASMLMAVVPLCAFDRAWHSDERGGRLNEAFENHHLGLTVAAGTNLYTVAAMFCRCRAPFGWSTIIVIGDGGSL